MVHEVAVLGFGRVGSSISVALAKRGHVVSAVATENADKAQALLPEAFITPEVIEACKKAATVIIAVPDRAIAEVADKIAPAMGISNLVVHTSGSAGLAVLESCAKMGASVCVVHPLQTFPATDPSALTNAPVAVVSSNSTTLKLGFELATAWGGKPFELTESQTEIYHAAAVLASAGTATFAAAAQRLFSDAGLDPSLLQKLVRRSVDNVLLNGQSAITGPGVRRDHATIARNLKALSPDIRAAYSEVMNLGATLSSNVHITDAELSGNGPKLVRTKDEFREICAASRNAGNRNGLVLTMGALHDGHASLIQASKRDCDFTAVTIYVNPTQFNDAADFENYPSTFDADLARCEALGVDVVFAPHNMYGEGCSTLVAPRPNLVGRFEGQHRPGHFDGMATVVTKFFALFGTGTAYFGRKDYQQLRIVEALSEDLDLGIEVVGMPLIREADGLAMSSRNVKLTPEQRKRATQLSKALFAVKAEAAQGVSDPDVLEALGREMIAEAFDETDYFEICDPATLQRTTTAKDGDLIIAAARIAGIRLIDNEYIGGNND